MQTYSIQKQGTRGRHRSNRGLVESGNRGIALHARVPGTRVLAPDLSDLWPESCTAGRANSLAQFMFIMFCVQAKNQNTGESQTKTKNLSRGR